jgi:hypothetical protein
MYRPIIDCFLLCGNAPARDIACQQQLVRKDNSAGIAPDMVYSKEHSPIHDTSMPRRGCCSRGVPMPNLDAGQEAEKAVRSIAPEHLVVDFPRPHFGSRGYDMIERS